MKIILSVLFVLLLVSPVVGADVNLAWDAAPGATGYKVYASTDLGITWSIARDAGNKLFYLWLGATDTGLTLFRVSAYNSQGESLRTESGAWYNGSWVLPTASKGLGIK